MTSENYRRDKDEWRGIINIPETGACAVKCKLLKHLLQVKIEFGFKINDRNNQTSLTTEKTNHSNMVANLF